VTLISLIRTLSGLITLITLITVSTVRISLVYRNLRSQQCSCIQLIVHSDYLVYNIIKPLLQYFITATCPLHRVQTRPLSHLTSHSRDGSHLGSQDPNSILPPRRLRPEKRWEDRVVKQGCWKSEDQGHQFRYHMTRKLRDAFILGLHRDAFQLDNVYALGSGLNRDAFTWGNFSPGGEMLESRRDSPQNTITVLKMIVGESARGEHRSSARAKHTYGVRS
jgi:hypothetical protein